MFSSDMQKIKVQSTRTDLATSIRTNIKDFASIYNSSLMPGNTTLFNCLNGATPTSCVNYAEVPFTFYGSIKIIPVMDVTTGLQKLDVLRL